MIELRPEDELPHVPDGEDDAPWKDTWWFVARDQESDVSVHAHCTLSANREPPCRTTVLVQHGRREALGLLRTDATRRTSDTVGNDLLQIHIAEPDWGDGKRIRLAAHLDEVDVALDLTGRFDAADVNVLCPGVLPDRSGGPTGPAAGGVLRHIEAAMSFTGTLEWRDGERAEVSGIAIRDRSWGWRKTQEMFRYGWEGFFGHGLDYSVGIGCFRASDAPGSEDARASAWIADGKGIRVVQDAEIRVDGTGRPISLSMTTVDGQTLTATTVSQDYTAHLPFHDPDPAGNALMIVQAEYHLSMVDGDGAPFAGMYTAARPIRTSVLEGAKFHTGT